MGIGSINWSKMLRDPRVQRSGAYLCLQKQGYRTLRLANAKVDRRSKKKAQKVPKDRRRGLILEYHFQFHPLALIP